MEHKSILITDDVHDVLISGFEQAGFDIIYKPKMQIDEVLNQIEHHEGLIINSKIGVNADLLVKAKKLKFVGRLGSGLDHIDLKACENAGVAVFRSPEGNANAVGEHCLAMLLALLNKVHISNFQLKNNIWLREENRGQELDGLTVGIIGYGHTGPAFAKKLKGFDVKIMIYDKYKNVGVPNGAASLEEILEFADVISFHVPLNTDTFHMVDEVFIEKCQRKPILINSSRGEIFATNEVLSGLKKGALSGLCIDVFEDEPISKGLKNSNDIYLQLINMDQVISSPHVAGWSHRSKYLLSKILLDKVLTFLN